MGDLSVPLILNCEAMDNNNSLAGSSSMHKLESKLEVESGPESKSEPVLKPESELESEPGLKPDSEPESESGLKPESEPGLKPESEPGLKPESESESEPGLKPESESEPELGSETESGSELESEEPESEPESNPESEQESNPESELESEQESNPESEPESTPESEPESEPERKPVLANPFAPLERKKFTLLSNMFQAKNDDSLSSSSSSSSYSSSPEQPENNSNPPINSFLNASNLQGNSFPDHLNPFLSKNSQMKSLQPYAAKVVPRALAFGYFHNVELGYDWSQFRRYPITSTLWKSGKTCPLCSYGFFGEILDGKVILLECNHILHEICFEYWVNLNRSCPDCHREIVRKWLMN